MATNSIKNSWSKKEHTTNDTKLLLKTLVYQKQYFNLKLMEIEVETKKSE
jgi:hypothetical protein